ncbi:4685_t:CDS:2 [Funneliformis caledonium]|uniref:4685_t:CDS:1 n=1 Tax=Funneliformis caledonium TaxID=1117310 RepID=A0A9N9E8M8_9GLOM|nr:4685_t:CDS:2 [Funneliformis caledonium]
MHASLNGDFQGELQETESDLENLFFYEFQGMKNQESIMEAPFNVEKITADDINIDGMKGIEDIVNTSLIYSLLLLKVIICN